MAFHLPTLNTLWVGGKLSYIERLCLQSMLDAGHHVVLFHYDDVVGIPTGVEVRDARKIFDEAGIATFFGRSPPKNAMIANIFRYELMRRGLGYWVDLDVYVLKPINFGTDHVFGWEDQRAINNAVLHLPRNSPILNRLLAYVYQKPIIPPWWSLGRKSKQRVLALFDADQTASELPWGSFGPRLLTYFVKKEGFADKALSSEAFYPLHYTKSKDVLDPNDEVDALFTEKTMAIHLWNKSLSPYKDVPPLPKSFLQRMCSKHGVDFEIKV